MTIDCLRIESFGAFCGTELTPGPCFNVITGENDSGKTTAAAFPGFLFYGFADKTEMDARMPVSGADAAGEADCTLTAAGAPHRHIRISRRVTAADAEAGNLSGTVVCTDTDTGEDIPLDAEPGKILFGTDAGTYAVLSVTSVGDEAAVLGKLTSALFGMGVCTEETETACARLEEEKKKLYDPETGTGEIPAMERERDALNGGITAAADSDGTVRGLREELASVRARRAVNDAQLEALKEAYTEKQDYDKCADLPDVGKLTARRDSASKRAQELRMTMFRGDYVPDGSFVQTLHECAEGMRSARNEEDSAKEQMRTLDFKARSDNLKENLMAQTELDGGVEHLQDVLERLRRRRLSLTVFGVMFLVLTFFSLAATVVLILMTADIVRSCILTTLVLGLFTIGTLLLRSRRERETDALLLRYLCETEDEFENFLEECAISAEKLKEHTAGKSAAEETLARGEEAYQGYAERAAELLAKLQPRDAEKITAARLTPDILDSAADRITRTLTEIEKKEAAAAQCAMEIAETIARAGELLPREDGWTEESFAAYQRKLKERFGENAGEEARTDAEAAVRDYELAVRSNEAMESWEAELKRKLLAFGIAADDDGAAYPCAVDAEVLKPLLEEAETALAEMRRRYRALGIAAEELRRSAEELQADTLPRLCAGIGGKLSSLTGGKYVSFRPEEGGPVLTDANGADIPVPKMSAGTAQLTAFCMRSVIGGVRYAPEMPPSVYDDAFPSADNGRLSSILNELLASSDSANGGVQVFLFTGGSRERERTEVHPRCTVLKLRVEGGGKADG